jgi:hypothetical protein
MRREAVARRAIQPTDLALAMRLTPGATYDGSQVLLAKASFGGTLELLTAAWETVLGYRSHEIAAKTLGGLMRSGTPAALVAAILDEHNPDPVDLTLRCRSGAAKRFRLHRRFDDYLREVFILAEETPSPAVPDDVRAAEDGAVPGPTPQPRLVR